VAAITGHFNVRLVYGAGPTTVDLDPAAMIRIQEPVVRGENVAADGTREVVFERLETLVFLGYQYLLTAEATALLTYWRTHGAKGLQATLTLDRLSSSAGQWEYDNYNTFFTKAELLNNPFAPSRAVRGRPRYALELQFRQGK